MWDNDTYGCCVTSEEAFAKACARSFMFWPDVDQAESEIFITDDTVLAWATANNVLNGADLVTVLDTMQTAGFQQDGKLYNNGPAQSVDWTNPAILQNAISRGPVKTGVAADQLESAVPDPPTNGWLATGFQEDSNEDHCVSLCGYGSVAWLAKQLGVGVIPSAPSDAAAYALFTWDSIGIIEVASMLAITGEAWLRSPGTIIVPQSSKNYG